MPLQSSPDIVIIGSGIGGATVAHGLANSGALILVLERGERILEHPDTRDERAVFQRDVFKPKDALRDETGSVFTPNNHACVGGNSKFYGAVMLRLREQDFLAREQPGGASVAWPFTYADLEPWYCAAEQLFRIRGQIGEDPTEPSHSRPYAYDPVPDEPAIAMLRERLLAQGLNPFSLPFGDRH